MNAEQFLALADALRSYALHSGRDLNASNLFVHAMLMRAVQSNGADETPKPPVLPREKELSRAA